MRVLFVNDYAFEAGGAETLVAAERSCLEARGHRTALFSLDSEDLYGPANDWWAPFRDPRGRIASTLHQLWNPAAGRAMKRAVARFEPELIHYHTLTRLSSLVLTEAVRRPAVLTMHDYGVMYPLLKRRFPDGRFCGVGRFPCCTQHAGVVRYLFEVWRTGNHRRRMQNLRYVLVPSRYMEAVAGACGMAHVVYCQNGVSNELAVVGPHKRTAEILYAGRFEQEKGVLALIAAFELVADGLPTVRLALAGAGNARGAVVERARTSRHSDKIGLLGHLTAQDLAWRYATCRAVAVPSLWPEPFGLVGLEAMFAGTPVVGSGRGGMSEWLQEEQNGLIADPEDADAFSGALTRILTDDALYARLSAACEMAASRFDISQHVERLERIYGAAVA
jgi:glycosyltransferase involved in cell wall biosynthesis